MIRYIRSRKAMFANRRFQGISCLVVANAGDITLSYLNKN